MRRFAITTIALLGLAAPGAALAQGAAQPPAPSSPQTPAQPAAPAAADAADASRSLFEPTSREFLIGGRFTSVDGDPARYQRYQDQRDGLLFSNFRYSFAKPDGTWDFHARAENVGYRDQEFIGSYDRIGKLSLSGSWQQIPQFYSVDTMTPYTGTGGTLLLDDATQRAIQNGDRPSSTPTSRWRRRSSCASGATSAVSTWSRRRSRTSTSRPASRRRSTAASCPGGPASASATTSRWRSPTIRARTTSPSAPSGRTRATCCVSPTAAPGSTTSRRR